MKKKILAVIISLVLVLTVVMLVGCTDNKKVEENVTVNQAQASAPTVINEELASINPDAGIDIALKHAGISRENAVMFGTPSLDEENGKYHYDIKFGYNGFEYEYEIAVDDGAVLKAEKEAEKVEVPVKETAPEKSEVPVSKENKDNKNNNNKNNHNNGYISVEAAKQKALDDAGVNSEVWLMSQISASKIKYQLYRRYLG